MIELAKLSFILFCYQDKIYDHACEYIINNLYVMDTSSPCKLRLSLNCAFNIFSFLLLVNYNHKFKF